jgi:hypothetical protein
MLVKLLVSACCFQLIICSLLISGCAGLRPVSSSSSSSAAALETERAPDNSKEQTSQWQSDVSELFDKAENSTFEHSRFYFRTRDAKGETREHRTGIVEGSEVGLDLNLEEAENLLTEIAKTKPIELSGCFLHTHPRRVVEYLRTLDPKELKDRRLAGLEKLDRQGVILAPPSDSDIAIDIDYNDRFAKEKVRPKITQALVVVDASGLWYFDILRSDKAREQVFKDLGASTAEVKRLTQQRRDLNDFRIPLMIEVSEKNIPAEQVSSLASYKKLALFYATQDVRIRFVPAKKVQAEPPCSGF